MTIQEAIITAVSQKLNSDSTSLLTSQKIQAEAWFRELRDLICLGLEDLEREQIGSDLPPARFERKTWERPGGGGGEMAVIKNGRIFEKGGVNVSAVHGEFSETMRKEIPGAAENPSFWASGVSLVLHPRSPHVPIVHMNTRMVVVGSESRESRVESRVKKDLLDSDHATLITPKNWFGGGADLTPVFPDAEDTAQFHQVLKGACDAFDPGYYPKYKQWCDEYFYLKHRKEPRGVGGIFYDYLEEGEWERRFTFTKAVGQAFLSAYAPIVRKHMNRDWSEDDVARQLHKRSRYVEFNLLWDRGTRFGIMTDGNTEAILMSMPPLARWE